MLADNGKCVSERHAEAEEHGMMTAGQVAQELRRKFELKVKAGDLKEFADEWHHSGFYKCSNGSMMGRTYFFAADTNLQELASKIENIQTDRAEVAKEPDIERYYFEVKFRKEYGRYGRKHWQPYAAFGSITLKPSESMTGKKRMEINQLDYELMKAYDGCDLEAYETFGELKKRKAVD